MKKSMKILACVLTTTILSGSIVSCSVPLKESELYIAPHEAGTVVPTLPDIVPTTSFTLSDKGEKAKETLVGQSYYISDLFSEEAEYLVDFPDQSAGFCAVSSNMITSLAYIEVPDEEDLPKLLDSMFESLDMDEEECVEQMGEYLVYTIEEEGTITRIFVNEDALSILFLCEGKTGDFDCFEAFGM